MSVIATIREALADAAGQIDGVTASAYMVDQVVTPHVVVSLRTIDYDLTMARGADVYTFTVSAYVSRSALPQQLAKLDDLCEPAGATSLKEALEADATVAAAEADYIRVRNVQGADERLVGQLPYLFVDFEVEVVV